MKRADHPPNVSNECALEKGILTPSSLRWIEKNQLGKLGAIQIRNL